MSEFCDVLFNKEKPFVPVPVAGGTTNGRVVRPIVHASEEHLENSDKIAYEDDVYQMKCQLKKKLQLAATQDNAEEPKADRPTDEVFTKYQFGHRTQAASRLPVNAFKSEILSKIAKFPAVVIEGSTGCGKSTQVCLFYMDLSGIVLGPKFDIADN